MNTALNLTDLILGGSFLITGKILIGNWTYWTILVVAYPISLWMVSAITSSPSTTWLVANRLAMLLACGYAMVALLTLLKKRRKMIAVAPQLQIVDNGAHVAPKPEKMNDKIGRFLSEEKLTQFDSVINQFLKNNKPFLQQKYSLRDLADDVDIPVNYLSAFINRYYKMNYSDFINRFRVSQSKEMILDGQWKNKTLEAIASEAGFNNRNTFTAAFRKETGQSPSEYLKEIKNAHRANKPKANKTIEVLV